jgi:hypothetical protein
MSKIHAVDLFEIKPTRDRRWSRPQNKEPIMSLIKYLRAAALRRPKHLLAGLIILAVTGVGCLSAFSGTKSSAGNTFVSSIAPRRAEDFKPRLGTYFYSVKWLGLRAADAIVTVAQDGEFYRVVADTTTSRLIDQLLKLRYRCEGLIRAQDYMPIVTVFDFRKRSRHRHTIIRYLNGGEIEVTETKTKKKQEPRTEIKKIPSEEFVLEPFSASFLARGFNWRKGEIQQLEVITGKKKYLVTLTCLDKVQVADGDAQTEAWIIRPAVKNLNKPKSKPRHSSTRIYLSTDDSRNLLKMKSRTLVGPVKVELERFVAQ